MIWLFSDFWQKPYGHLLPFWITFCRLNYLDTFFFPEK